MSLDYFRRMLEKQDKRKITLVEVMNICRLESICAQEETRQDPPTLSPFSSVSTHTPANHKVYYM